MVQASDARKADGRCQTVSTEHNQGFVVVLVSHDTRKGKCGARVTRRKRLPSPPKRSLPADFVGSFAIESHFETLDDDGALKHRFCGQLARARGLFITRQLSDSEKRKRGSCHRQGSSEVREKFAGRPQAVVGPNVVAEPPVRGQQRCSACAQRKKPFHVSTSDVQRTNPNTPLVTQEPADKVRMREGVGSRWNLVRRTRLRESFGRLLGRVLR